MKKVIDYLFFDKSYVKNGILHIKPTLTADRYGKEFLSKGTLDLSDEGCTMEPYCSE